MDTDLVLTLGIVLTVLTIPTLLAAWSEGRPPRVGAIMMLTALGLVLTAVVAHPGGYQFNEVPEVMLRVAARLTD
jgi:hypothetical protein